jgi:hypothetical protein
MLLCSMNLCILLILALIFQTEASRHRKQSKIDHLPIGIVGGAEVESVNKYPWIAALMVDNQVICGGSMISSYAILTAARNSFVFILDCTYLHRYKKERLSAMSHRNDLNKTPDEENAFKFKVLKVILHPDYKETDNGVRHYSFMN